MNKKLTREQFEDIYVENHSLDHSYRINYIYEALLPYLADEQPAENPTKPEPSRLEVAMNLLAAHISKPNAAYAEDLVSNMFKAADELIKKSKL